MIHGGLGECSALGARTVMCSLPSCLPIRHVVYALVHPHALILHVRAMCMLLWHALMHEHVVAHEIRVLMLSHVCNVHVHVVLSTRIA